MVVWKCRLGNCDSFSRARPENRPCDGRLENDLTELDLSPVPGLIDFYCHGNFLPELDLAPVPRLARLDCGSNKLTRLDLSPAPGITWLDCRNNIIAELDLTPVPGVVEIYCQESWTSRRCRDWTHWCDVHVESSP